MIAHAVKVALKTGLILTGLVLVFAVFSSITIPTLDFAPFFNALGKGLAIVTYWIPITKVLFPVVYWLFVIEIGIITLKYTIMASKIILKVNE